MCCWGWGTNRGNDYCEWGMGYRWRGLVMKVVLRIIFHCNLSHTVQREILDLHFLILFAALENVCSVGALFIKRMLHWSRIIKGKHKRWVTGVLWFVLLQCRCWASSPRLQARRRKVPFKARLPFPAYSPNNTTVNIARKRCDIK